MCAGKSGTNKIQRVTLGQNPMKMKTKDAHRAQILNRKVKKKSKNKQYHKDSYSIAGIVFVCTSRERPPYKSAKITDKKGAKRREN